MLLLAFSPSLPLFDRWRDLSTCLLLCLGLYVVRGLYRCYADSVPGLLLLPGAVALTVHAHGSVRDAVTSSLGS